MINGLLDMGTKLYQAFIEDRWRLYLDGLGVTLGITLGAIVSAPCWWYSA